MQFKTEKERLDQEYEAFPPEFKVRIDRYRSNNPTFRVESESYEMFCCTQAIELVPYFRTLKIQAETSEIDTGMNSVSSTVDLLIESFEDKINSFKELSFPEMKKLVSGLDDGHSGNTFGGACGLAYAYIEGKPI